MKQPVTMATVLAALISSERRFSYAQPLFFVCPRCISLRNGFFRSFERSAGFVGCGVGSGASVSESGGLCFVGDLEQFSLTSGVEKKKSKRERALTQQSPRILCWSVSQAILCHLVHVLERIASQVRSAGGLLHPPEERRCCLAATLSHRLSHC